MLGWSGGDAAEFNHLHVFVGRLPWFFQRHQINLDLDTLDRTL